MTTTIARLRLNQGVMETLKEIGQQYLEEGKPAEALRLMKTYLEAKPDDGEARALEAKSLASLSGRGA
jgi:hypothetical protein